MKVIKRTFLTAAVTLFAAVFCLLLTGLVLAACSEKVTLRFVTNGGTEVESVEGAVGAVYRAPSDPEKEGYFFDGWYLQSDFSGERQELPEKMPSKSTTYYAKYGKYVNLTLETAGGRLDAAEHRLKPKTNLSDYLKNFVPEKEGLVFGGWMKNGEPINENTLMPEEDLTLTARYKANFAVNVYVQDPDEPEKFEKSEIWSKSGADWEGKTLFPKLPEEDCFYLDPSKEATFQCVLGAGENILDYYYLREEIELHYTVTMPGGEVRTTSETSRYGAHASLWEGPSAAEGTILYGWAETENGSAKYVPGQRVTVGGEDMLLYGTWARKYSDAKRGGYFAVEEIADGTKHSARYVAKSGEYETGVFDENTRSFEAEKTGGKLDGKGYFLPDDSGVYQGYDLAANRTDAEKFGTLKLDFAQGTAEYTLGGGTRTGTYDFVWDNEKNRYAGFYRFSAEGESFSFALDETSGTFRREGAEKGEYARLEQGSLSEFRGLSLDGFGNAVYKDRGKEIVGVYAGAGKENEWLFRSDGENFRFLAGTRSWSVGGTQVFKERGFLVYSDELSGTYTGAGTLTLDGYGLNGEYVPANGQKITGSFTREGSFVTLQGAQKLRFTLQGGSFSLTGEEAGTYEGEMGTLFLDGGGQGELSSETGKVSGTYVRNGEADLTFCPAQGGKFRFKLFENEYRVYDPALYGSYEGRYDEKLTLDGFGSGVYTTDAGNEIPVSVGYHDAGFIELCSPLWSKPHYFKLFSGSEMSLLSGRSVGVYRVYQSGSPDGSLLVLDENGIAKLSFQGTALSGTYQELSRDEIKFLTGGRESRYRLTEKNGVAAAIEFAGAGTYSGGGTLKLDGFETAVYTANAVKAEGQYTLFEGGAELYTNGGLWRFALSGSIIERASYFEGASGERGDLYLETGGTGALLRGKTTDNGTYETLSNASGEYFLFRGAQEFRFKREGEIYLIYDEKQEATYHSADGGTLRLDGCGRAVFSRGELRAEGEAEYGENGLILFRSEHLASQNGVRAFRVSNGALEILGAEYGEYRLGQEILFLDGEGGAVYLGVPGSYTLLSGGQNEYEFAGGGVKFRFRLSKDAFERYGEGLAALAGVYQTQLGSLSVTEYGALLTKEDGSSSALQVLYAAGRYLIARDETGALLGFVLGETSSVSAASCLFSPGTAQI